MKYLWLVLCGVNLFTVLQSAILMVNNDTMFFTTLGSAVVASFGLFFSILAYLMEVKTKQVDKT